MTESNAYLYLSEKLDAALADAPGGEKAWVPVRRGLALAVRDHLRQAAQMYLLLAELRAALGCIVGAQEEDTAQAVPAVHAVLEVDIEQSAWESTPRPERVELIRRALKNGAAHQRLPDRKTWKRHYPEAFANGQDAGGQQEMMQP